MSLQVRKRTTKYHPRRTYYAHICAAHINAKFGRADEMNFKVEGPWNTEKYLEF